jgi:hypothetical protein
MVRRLLLAVLLLAGFAALPAAAQVADLDVDEVAADLRADGYWVEEGMRIDESAVSAALDRADNVLYLIVLADDRGTDPAFIAEEIAAEFASGTFIARTDAFLGIYSIDFGQDAVQRASAAFTLPDAEGIEAADRALSAAAAPAGGGGGGFPWGTIVVLVIGGGVAWMVMSSNRRSSKAAAKRLDEAREQLSAQADDVADDILALTEIVQAADDPAANEHYREANRIFAETEELIVDAAHERELVDISNRLTEAEWRLEAAEAIIDGREPPTKPTTRPIECFFHSTKAGVEEAMIETPAGEKTVSVCRDCAERLRRGEDPTERLIQVGGRSVPAGMAPRSYGGGGVDPMGVFGVMMAGQMMRRHSWGGARPGRRPRPTGRIGSPGRVGGGRASRRL